jgi:hypothetical protein
MKILIKKINRIPNHQANKFLKNVIAGKIEKKEQRVRNFLLSKKRM